MNTHDMTCQLSCGVTASNRPGATWTFSSLPGVSLEECDRRIRPTCANLILTARRTFAARPDRCFATTYSNTGVWGTSKAKNNCQVLASSFQLFDISAEAAMHRIWFPSELFLSLARKTPHICDRSALNSALFRLATQQSRRLFRSQMWCHPMSLYCLFSSWKKKKLHLDMSRRYIIFNLFIALSMCEICKWCVWLPLVF